LPHCPLVGVGDAVVDVEGALVARHRYAGDYLRRRVERGSGEVTAERSRRSRAP
jgi:hypothetical protein